MKELQVHELRSLNNYSKFIEKIKKNETFSFVRFGDGEWALILRKDPVFSVIKKRWKNNPLLEEFSLRLKKIIQKGTKYHFGLQPLALKLYGKEISKMVPDFVEVSNSDIFHNVSIKGEMNSFFESLNDRNVILVGRGYLKGMKKYFNFHHIVSPEYFWNEKDSSFIERIEAQVDEKIKETENPVILYSAGIVGKMILDKMYSKYSDRITQIDTGALFEPYVGLNIRGYHKAVVHKLSENEKH